MRQKMMPIISNRLIFPQLIAAQIRENHGLSRCPRKYASPEISTLHRFASI
jgi:hypothetical protein